VDVSRVDVDAAREHRVWVTNMPGVNAAAVAELAFGQMIALARYSVAADRAVKANRWADGPRFQGTELAGKTIGIVGMGNIGTRVALRARAFEMALLGGRVPASQALEWGLVNWVHPDDRLMPEAEALVERLATGPTRSYAGSKRALNRSIYGDLQAQLDLEAELQHELARTKDFLEGVGAFVEKREAAFTGA
jgi:lactate dehydrogenase-like 2-hydroxyacid dehydrogenase